MVKYAVVFALALLLTMLLTPAVRKLAQRMGWLDLPGVRKVHTTATPRDGGGAVFLAMTITLLIANYAYADVNAADWLPTLVGGAIVFAIGFWDDIQRRSVALKLAAQLAAAIVALVCGVSIDNISIGGTTYALGVLSIPLTLAWIVGITNAFNLVDGLDGLATGLAIIAAGTCACITLIRGDTSGSLLLLALLGALVGFLRYNFNPASIFLGDGGSLFIGFVLAVSAITSFQKGAVALTSIAPLLVFALPIADTLFSIARRTRSAGITHIADADMAHIHHRLVSLGISQRKAVLLLYVIALVCSLIALLTVQIR